MDTENSIAQWAEDTKTALNSVYEVNLQGVSLSRNESDVLVVDKVDKLAGYYCGYNENDYKVDGIYEKVPYEIDFYQKQFNHPTLGSEIADSIQNAEMPEYDLYVVFYYYLTEDGTAHWEAQEFLMDGIETDLKFADDTEEEKNYCGDNATYTLDENGLLTISGTGAIYDDAFEENEDIKKVVIEDGITEIGYCAFSNCSNLSSLNLPNSLIIIGSESFTGCSNLTNVVIPDSVTDIWNGAFANCKNLVNVELPSGLDY